MLQGHVEIRTPCVEYSGGSLGQGISFACGLAYSAKLKKKKHKVFCILGDGECHEGEVWEAAMFASHYKLDNLYAVVDQNHYCTLGNVDDIMNLEPLEEKWKSFGWNTATVNGHDYNELLDALNTAKNYKGKPTVIIANTVKGKGISFMEKNVGVSNCAFMKKKNGCPWKMRRQINERALNTNKLHIYASKYNQDIRKSLLKLNDKSIFTYNDFIKFGKLFTSQIVFNTNKIHDDVFNIFTEANSLKAFSEKFEINKVAYNNYIKILKYYIKNPVDNSLVKLLVKETNNEEELIHQIPHFIFPMVGLFVTTIPRLLVLLFNHRNILERILKI